MELRTREQTLKEIIVPVRNDGVKDLKSRAFSSYLSTHHFPRKGVITEEVLRSQARRWNKSLRRFLPTDKTALIVDIGCGYGSVVWWLHDIGYAAAEGVDLSGEQVAAAKGLGIANIHQGDLREYFSGKIGLYDAILARDVFEHFEHESLAELLTLIREALKPGGVLIFQVPNAESPFGNRILYGDITHELAFTSSSVRQLMHLIGFADVQTYPVGPVVYGATSLVRLLLWKMVEAFYRALITIEIGRGSWIVSQNLIAVVRR